MKMKKQKNKGISLIVLVITIIVMIILASAIIITLGNSGIIGKANEAVDTTNLKQVQQAATLAWADAYAGGARTETELKASVEESLKDIDTSNYIITVTENGVTVELKNKWVTATVDGVPIPKGFVASPYGADETNGIAAENTKAGGLVIYELTADEIANGATTLPSDETQFESWTTRNQFVWVPVDKDNFVTEFVRKDFLNSTSQVVDTNGAYNNLGTSSVYWELEMDENNMPKGKTLLSDYIADSDLDYISEATIAEAQAMYASVKEYGGFYIARYEAGTSNARTSSNYTDEDGNVILEVAYSMMNKYPYNYIGWTSSTMMNGDEGGVVEASRSMYPSTNANYGVVSTLTYGVQWDRTLQWYIDTGAMTLKEVTENSKSFGNFYDSSISSYTALNTGAKYTTSGTVAFTDITATYTKGSSTSHLLTTGALKAANINNIYDMAGNVGEWTMEGLSTDNRVVRGSVYSRYYPTHSHVPVSYRKWGVPTDTYMNRGFRISLYIKSLYN